MQVENFIKYYRLTLKNLALSIYNLHVHFQIALHSTTVFKIIFQITKNSAEEKLQTKDF